MTIKHLFPEVFPTLNLDFANSKALDSRITFTRSSIGTYIDSRGIIQTAADDEPRFDHDPVTGESLGLLLEESRTNLITYSSDTTNAVWNHPRSTQTIGGTAPDGSSTANDVTVTISGFNGSVNQNLTVAGNHAYSVFVKKKGFSVFRFGFTVNLQDNVNWNIDTNTFSNQGANVVSTSSTDVGDGWYRVSVVYNIATSALYGFQVFVVDNPGNTYTTVNGTDGFYMWGAQLEAGATFPTSYIATSGSAVTRAADVASITGTNFSSWYNDAATTLYIESPDFPNHRSISNSAFVYISDQNVGAISVKDGIKFGTSSSETGNRVFVTEGGGNQANGLATQGSKFAIAVSENDFNYTVDGTSVGTDTAVIMPTGMDRLVMTPYGPGLAHLSRLSYYPIRLPDGQLQALTD